MATSMMRVSGVQQEINRVKKWMEEEVKGADQVFRGYAADLFARLVHASPQDSGDFTANWNYSIGSPDNSYQEGLVPSYDPSNPFKQGDNPAKVIARLRNTGKDVNLKIGDTVYITNRSTHKDWRGREDEYYRRILDGTMSLRDANTRITIQAALAEFQTRYPRKLSGHKLGALKRKRVGSEFS